MFEQSAHAINLVLGVPWSLVVIGIGPGEVNGVVGHVEIPGYHDGLLRIEPLDLFEKGLIPLLSERQPLEARRRIRRVHCYEKEGVEFCTQYTALLVQFFDPNSRYDGEGSGFGQNGGS